MKKNTFSKNLSPSIEIKWLLPKYIYMFKWSLKIVSTVNFQQLSVIFILGQLMISQFEGVYGAMIYTQSGDKYY